MFSLGTNKIKATFAPINDKLTRKYKTNGDFSIKTVRYQWSAKSLNAIRTLDVPFN